MTEKPEGKRRRWWSWIVTPLLLLYLFSMGPAFRFFGMPGTVPYAPILIGVCTFPKVGQPVVWYLNLWARQGVTVQIVDRDLLVSEVIP